MSSVVISDTSCLSLFQKIGHLELLKHLFEEIIITSIIQEEFKHRLPDWIIIKNPESKIYLSLTTNLDPGEASAIALAMEIDDSLLVIDELKGRKVAKNLNIPIIGSLGLLVIAKNRNIIKSVKPVIRKIKETNFRISNELVKNILRLSNELPDD